MPLKKIVSPFFISLFFLILVCPERAFPQTDYLKNGIANLKQENYEEAVEDLKKARHEDPKSSTAAYFLGVAYKKIQDYKNAKINLNDAITLKPKVKEAVIELADTLYQLGETEDALKNVGLAEKEDIEPAQTAFLKGLVLSKMGKNLEAVESFKKAKDLDKKLAQSADYQIAVATLQEGKLNEAKLIFKEIVVKDPNADIAQFSNQYIDAITKRLKAERPFRLNLGIQYQYDDNVLLKPGDSAVAAGITDEDDSLEAYTLRTEYAPRLKGPFGIKAQYSFYLNNHHKFATHDVQSHTIALVPSYNFKSSSINLLASYNYTFVDDYKYLSTITLSPTYTFIFTQKQFASGFLRYQHKEYLKPPINADEDRDSNDYAIGASWFYLIKENKGFLNARYEFNKEDTDGRNWGYNGNKIGLAFLYPITEKLNFNIGGEAYFQRFDETHTAFNKKRDDNTYTVSSMLSYTVYDDVDIQVQYIYISGDSNIAVYDYDKNIASIGVEVGF